MWIEVFKPAVYKLTHFSKIIGQVSVSLEQHPVVPTEVLLLDFSLQNIQSK